MPGPPPQYGMPGPGANPTLYNNLNTAATNLNQLVLDFQADPKRYLRELRLVDVF